MKRLQLQKIILKWQQYSVEVPNEREVEYPHFSKVNFKKTNIKFYGCNHRYKG
jgi:hypothetical protein